MNDQLDKNPDSCVSLSVSASAQVDDLGFQQLSTTRRSSAFCRWNRLPFFQVTWPTAEFFDSLSLHWPTDGSKPPLVKKNKKSKTGGRIPHSFHWFTRRKGKPPSTYFCMVISHIVNGWEGFFTRIRQVEENPESRHQPWQGVGVVESGIVGKSSIRPVGERFVHLDQWTSGRWMAAALKLLARPVSHGRLNAMVDATLPFMTPHAARYSWAPPTDRTLLSSHLWQRELYPPPERHSAFNQVAPPVIIPLCTEFWTKDLTKFIWIRTWLRHRCFPLQLQSTDFSHFITGCPSCDKLFALRWHIKLQTGKSADKSVP